MNNRVTSLIASDGRPIPLPGLTGLRGVGAMWVFIYHAQVVQNNPLFDAGYMGVDVFFILSGFVLSHAYSMQGWSSNGYLYFFRARMARLYPMHLTALILLLVLVLLWPHFTAPFAPGKFSGSELAASIFLVQSWGFGNPDPWNGPAWSLSAEMFASLIFPAVLIAARKSSLLANPIWLCNALLALFIVFLIITNNPNPGVIGRAGMVRMICEFGCGCVLYQAFGAGVRATWRATGGRSTDPGWAAGREIFIYHVVCISDCCPALRRE
ncbi:MAG: acyltransferase [Rhodospirillales bacterium]|nr:acyltransferase [Rhodospirillales bacterium]